VLQREVVAMLYFEKIPQSLIFGCKFSQTLLYLQKAEACVIRPECIVVLSYEYANWYKFKEGITLKLRN
jgi:hypothetical protein